MHSESAMTSKHILVPVMPADALDPVSAVHRLLKAFLGGRKAETITAYRQDLEDFQAFIQAPSLEQAASLLLAQGPVKPTRWPSTIRRTSWTVSWRPTPLTPD